MQSPELSKKLKERRKQLEKERKERIERRKLWNENVAKMESVRLKRKATIEEL